MNCCKWCYKEIKPKRKFCSEECQESYYSNDEQERINPNYERSSKDALYDMIEDKFVKRFMKYRR